VLRYRADHPFWERSSTVRDCSTSLGRGGFVLLVTLLFVSLVAYLVPRTRALWQAVRTPPMQAREIDAFPHYAEVSVADPPDRAIEAARRTLRRRRFRVARDPDREALAADKASPVRSGASRSTGRSSCCWPA
jgi:uncharacterized membrane protein